VKVYEPEPGVVVTDRDVPVTTRDGTVLRVNVYRPPDDHPTPVLLCAHPYGKDHLPTKKRNGFRVAFQYRAMRQMGPITFSSLTSWEAPDPVWCVRHGYSLVNVDLRGAGTSEGESALLSDQEGEDVYDVIEWAAAQPWSTGAVGMLGVSYLAISQWKAAALRPPSLAAIVAWEGFTDITLGPSATMFRAGEQLRLVVAERWLWPRNPLTGQFPAAYAAGSRGKTTLHWGSERQARLLVPVIIVGAGASHSGR
jgi:uncharacterized protein